MPRKSTRRKQRTTIRIRTARRSAPMTTKNANRPAKMQKRKPRRQLKKLRKRPLKKNTKIAMMTALKRIPSLLPFFAQKKKTRLRNASKSVRKKSKSLKR